MNKTVFAGNPNSQYNSDIVIKEVHDYYGQSLRIVDARSVIAGYFTHFRASYNVSNLPTEVLYYRGMTAHKTTITTSSAATLNNKFFVISSVPNGKLYLVWYNVDGAGTAPVYPSAQSIMVSVDSTDTDDLVLALTKATIDALYSDVFKTIKLSSNQLQIITNGFGESTDSFDVSTGFNITNQSGTQELVSKITISYIGSDPVFEGEVLKGYSFDIYSGKFVKNPEIALSTTTTPVTSQFFEITGIASGITGEIMSYTLSSTSLMQKIEVSGTNIAEYELVINGQTQDKKRTYFGDSLNITFDFDNGLSLTSGTVVKIYVYHNRPDNGDFNARIQLTEI